MLLLYSNSTRHDMKKLFTLFLVFFFSRSDAQTFKQSILKKDTATAIQLLRSGADVNAYDSISETDVLMDICRWESDPAMIGFLLRHGAKPDLHRSGKGRTALHIACAYYACETIIQLLVESGADVNAVTTDGTTPLMLAAQNAKARVVDYLLKKGAKKDLKNRSGKSALDYAKISKDDEETKKWSKCELDKAATIHALE
jgi:ankyrin repeat protein